MEKIKKCQECLSDIPEKAKRCSKCGAKQKTPTNWKVVLLLIIFVPIFIGILGSSGGGTVTNQNSASGDKAYIISQNFVELALKSPSTADFPLSANIQNLGNNKYKINSYVDSENGFGAMIRTNWVVTLQYNGGEWSNPSNWTLQELIMDNKMVYPSQ